MASRGGPWAAGTDGSDFGHRQIIASQYQVSALYKSRFRFCIFLHFLLFLIICAKVAEDVLDRLDIFILELEELYIPKPLLWEWIWLGSLLFAFFGLAATRRNRVSSMQIYVGGTVLAAIFPILGAAIYFFNDMLQFVETRDSSGLPLWRGYPVAALWYAFLIIASQVHFFSLYFAFRLINAWRVKKTK